MAIKIFADGADLKQMVELYKQFPEIKGLTTNPSLMKKAGITDYMVFAKKVLTEIPALPISFEVFADEADEMIRQARIIASWGEQVYIKIPITNTKGDFTGSVIKTLASEGIKLNITAIFTVEQVKKVVTVLDKNTPAIISVFAGRIANTGIDPMPIMKACIEVLKAWPKAELLWASSREALNIIQAEETGCHIITLTPDLIKTKKLFGHDLEKFSLETVQTFYEDAVSAGYLL